MTAIASVNVTGEKGKGSSDGCAGDYLADVLVAAPMLWQQKQQQHEEGVDGQPQGLTNGGGGGGGLVEGFEKDLQTGLGVVGLEVEVDSHKNDADRGGATPAEDTMSNSDISASNGTRSCSSSTNGAEGGAGEGGGGPKSVLSTSDAESVDDEEVETGSGVDEYTGVFEGPEKTLEVCFQPGVGHPNGCRELTRQQLDKICKRAKCTIISCISNQHLDAYVLSESSLFVYPFKVLIKTCGTTTLLRCIATLLEYAGELGMVLEWVGYSRKNYTFPGDQLFPHNSFDQELSYLQAHSHLSKRLDGAGYVLGPVTADHWFVYLADKYDRPDYTATDRTMNMMMFDMHPSVSQHFYKAKCGTGQAMAEVSGIRELVPGALVDDCAFDPCGYSMNAILYDSYYTIHVTPEEGCSYASFETNNPFKSYRSIIKNVLNVFKPGRYVLAMMADSAGLRTMGENPFDIMAMDVPGRGEYHRTGMNLTTVEGDTVLMMGNWELQNSPTRPKLPRERSLSIF